MKLGQALSQYPKRILKRLFVLKEMYFCFRLFIIYFIDSSSRKTLTFTSDTLRESHCTHCRADTETAGQFILPALGPGASYLASSCLSFLCYKMGATTVHGIVSVQWILVKRLELGDNDYEILISKFIKIVSPSYISRKWRARQIKWLCQSHFRAKTFWTGSLLF